MNYDSTSKKAAGSQAVGGQRYVEVSNIECWNCQWTGKSRALYRVYVRTGVATIGSSLST